MAINTRGAGKMYLDAMLTLWEQRKREQEQQRQYQQQWAMQNAANQFTLGRDRTQAEQQAERDRMLAAQTAERDRQLAAQRRRESEIDYARQSDADVMNNRGNVQALQKQFPDIYGNMPVDAFQSGVNDKMYSSLISQAQRQIEEQQDMERALEYRRQLNLPIEQGRKYSVSDPDIQLALRREQNNIGDEKKVPQEAATVEASLMAGMRQAIQGNVRDKATALDDYMNSSDYQRGSELLGAIDPLAIVRLYQEYNRLKTGGANIESEYNRGMSQDAMSGRNANMSNMVKPSSFGYATTPALQQVIPSIYRNR